jgi:hypothetical protein
VRIDGGVRVGLKINARHHAVRHRHPLTADRVAIDGDRRFNLRDAAEFQRNGALEESRLGNFQHREIAVVPDELDTRGVLVRVVVFFHDEEAPVADDMGVGHDALAVDDEARADPAADVARHPRHLVVCVLRGDADADEAFADFSRRRGRERGGGEQRRDEENFPKKTVHVWRED